MLTGRMDGNTLNTSQNQTHPMILRAGQKNNFPTEK